jgi:Methyltransferase FkbM domain
VITSGLSVGRAIGPLLERFKPDLFYGFDPHPATELRMGVGSDGKFLTSILIARKAAWVYDGVVPFVPAGLRSRIDEEGESVVCFDLARFLLELPEDEIIVKMDIEGAEKLVLEHLIATGADRRISLLLVEWHDHRDFVETFDRADLIARLHCPIEEWH